MSVCTFECNYWEDDTCESTCTSADISGSIPTEFVLVAYKSTSAGGTITLETGTDFAPTSSDISGYSVYPAAIQITKAVTIQCLDLENLCKLDGLEDKRVIYISSGKSSATNLIGLKITRGYASGVYGGGMYIQSSTVNLNQVFFNDNTAVSYHNL